MVVSHFLWVGESVHGFSENVESYVEEETAVDECGENFDPAETECVLSGFVPFFDDESGDGVENAEGSDYKV